MIRKYKLLKREGFKAAIYRDSPRKVSYHRIKALIDIPSIGVKAGDLGGYVTNRKILSHEGNCWIGENARVAGFVRVEDNAYITENANVLTANTFDFMSRASRDTTISGNAYIGGNAKIKTTIRPANLRTVIDGNASIVGDVSLIDMERISDNATIGGYVVIEKSNILGDTIISDKANINKSTIRDCRISEASIVRNGATLINVAISGKAIIGEGQEFSNCSFNENAVFMNDLSDAPKVFITPEGEHSDNNALNMSSSGTLDSLQLDSLGNESTSVKMFNEIVEKIDAYETDIVKIIRYPIMTDRTDPHTVAMVTAQNHVKRLLDNPSDQVFADAVLRLEEKFLAAESNAIKIATSELTDTQLKKATKARDLFSLASDEASGEHERKAAFIQGFKQLQGVVTVPEIAMDTFREKLGFKELTML